MSEGHPPTTLPHTVQPQGPLRVEYGEREGCGGYKGCCAFAKTVYISITAAGNLHVPTECTARPPRPTSRWNKGRADASSSTKVYERHHLSDGLRRLPTTTKIVTCSMEVVLSTGCAAWLSHGLQRIRTSIMTPGMAASLHLCGVQLVYHALGVSGRKTLKQSPIRTRPIHPSCQEPYSGYRCCSRVKPHLPSSVFHQPCPHCEGNLRKEFRASAYQDAQRALHPYTVYNRQSLQQQTKRQTESST